MHRNTKIMVYGIFLFVICVIVFIIYSSDNALLVLVLTLLTSYPFFKIYEKCAEKYQKEYETGYWKSIWNRSKCTTLVQVLMFLFFMVFMSLQFMIEGWD